MAQIKKTAPVEPTETTIVQTPDENFVRLRGRVASSEITSRETDKGVIVVKFTVATNVGRHAPEFTQVTCFGEDLARKAADLRTGSPVYILGRLRTSSWTPDDGSGTRWRTEVIASAVEA